MKGKKSDCIDYYLLKNFHWLLLTGEVRENKRRYNKRLQRYINYPQLLDLLLNISPELRTAYDLKIYTYVSTWLVITIMRNMTSMNS